LVNFPVSALTRVKNILRNEGTVALVRQLFSFAVHFLYQCETYYLHEHTMVERNEGDFLPKVKNYVVEIVRSNRDAEELAKKSYDLYSFSIYTRQRLEKGAIAFCILIGEDLAHVGWVTMNGEAVITCEPFQQTVDFKNGEACTGGTSTIPRHEGKGLMTYGCYRRFEYLRELGIKKARNAVATDNAVSLRVHAKFHPRIYAQARHLKILWWQSWKETPVE
jgi:RimJ/RimL family protein N-acetyltransferase